MKNILFLSFLLFSSMTTSEKQITLTLTVDEVNLIYEGLGELPAKRSEQLRFKIAKEASEQLKTEEK